MLDQELNRLPRKYRVPLILCYLEGRTHDQAAEELACPVGTVRSRLARGRDLLRRRLTSRGHAPTAAILGTETALPARLLTEAVPPSLVSATVKAALGIGASKTIQAGAVSASALALTQGVLTTMKLAQLKCIGLAILATSLSAGGVIAVSYAAGQGRKEGLDDAGIALKANAGGPQETPALEDTTQRSGKATRRALEPVDSESGRNHAESGRSVLGSEPLLKPDGEQGEPCDPARRSDPGARGRAELAIADDARTQQLFERAAISSSEREQARGKVLLIKARLEGLDDELERRTRSPQAGVKTERGGARTGHGSRWRWQRPSWRGTAA